MIKISSITLSFILIISSFSISAGKIYRFKDQNNVSTMSKVLPPYAAQKGYEILNDKTFSLIERVKSRDQVQDEKNKRKLEKKKLAKQKLEKEKREQAEKKLLSEKILRDKTLLDRYPSEQVLVKSHGAEKLYVQNKIENMKSQQAREIQKLIMLQSQAAEEEINNDNVPTNLKDKMSLSQQKIDTNKIILNNLINDREVMSQRYKSELKQLRKLLK